MDGSLGILVVALAPSIAVVLVGWCLAQLLFNAMLAAMVAVLRHVPGAVRDRRFFILLFAVTLNDRRLAKVNKPAWSLREFASI